GRFRQCFGKFKHRWGHRQIDSRDVEGTNKAQFQAWVDDYGEDSDFVRVRVRGRFPRASSLQFIPSDVVYEATKREAHYLYGDPLVRSLDIGRGGDDFCVFRFRRGFDARTIPPVSIPGSEVRDSMRLVSVAVELVNQFKPDYFVFDEVGVGGPVGDRIRQLGYQVFGFKASERSPNPKYLNMRAYSWAKMKEWFINGGAIDSNETLETD